MTHSLDLQRVLVAEDDPVSRRLLESVLGKWGFTPVVRENGAEAWQVLAGPESPNMAILDWMMPEIDGLELCRRIRATPAISAHYIILLTARGGHGNAVQGLQAGADDFVTKPFDFDELRARVLVGRRVVELQMGLAERVRDLEEALTKVKQLQGLVPICSYCKKIRNDQNYWQQIEYYISEHSEAQFSHGICPDCFEELMLHPSVDTPPKGETKL
jgi:phosphoserine phosphatase RsbU/P